MTSGAPQPIAPGAAGQLAALAAALAGGLLVALLATAALARWRRARGTVPVFPAGPDGPARSNPDLVLVRTRLLGAVVPVLLLLPTAAAVRQLWPHPALGWRLLAWWLVGASALVAAWLALAAVPIDRRRDA